METAREIRQRYGKKQRRAVKLPGVNWPPGPINLAGSPRQVRFSVDGEKAEEPCAGMLLRSARCWYVVLSVRATKSQEKPYNLTVARVTPAVAAHLVEQYAAVWCFAWD